MARKSLIAALALGFVSILAGGGYAAQLNAFRVDCTGTISHVAGSHGNRVGLVVQNVGTVNVYVGGDARAQLTLHVGSTLSLSGQEATGGLHCQTDGGSSRVDVLETLQ